VEKEERPAVKVGIQAEKMGIQGPKEEWQEEE